MDHATDRGGIFALDRVLQALEPECTDRFSLVGWVADLATHPFDSNLRHQLKPVVLVRPLPQARRARVQQVLQGLRVPLRAPAEARNGQEAYGRDHGRDHGNHRHPRGAEGHDVRGRWEAERRHGSAPRLPLQLRLAWKPGPATSP